MSFGEIAGVAFQALVVAEVVALIVARRALDSATARSLGTSWHRRLETLTYAVRPALLPALLLVAALAAAAILAVSLGAKWPAAPAFIVVPLLAGLFTWWVARDHDWDRAARSARSGP